MKWNKALLGNSTFLTGRTGSCRPLVPGPSDLHHFRVLLLAHLFHALDLVVGKLLHLVNGALLLIAGDGLVLRCFFDYIVAVAADVANSGAMVFKPAVAVLDNFLPPFLSHRRNRNPHNFAIVLRIKT